MDQKKQEMELLRTPSGKKWEGIGAKRKAGIMVPLFSLYSQDSVGIGDFRDLESFIFWAGKTGSQIIQLLPMNEVGSLYCPYDSISSFALEPLYLCLEKIIGAPLKRFAGKLADLKKKFPAGLSHVNYALKKEKERLLWDIFQLDQGHKSPDFAAFQVKNEYWLRDFALFKVIKTNQMERAWHEWETGYKDRDRGSLDSFFHEHRQEIIFQEWLQWQCFLQFSRVKHFARENKVFLKGDLPILVSRDSADVWAHREFFKLEFAAGAPPDMYCSKGQRWGMPTYRWENIANEDYRYLKEKLRYAENFYDILRIDHVVGLFRIWSIPAAQAEEDQGLNGSFDPAQENTWQEHGSRILKVINEHTGMLLCAEDLGMIPPSCPQTLREMGIPGNDVQRWVKDWNVKHDFLPPDEYRFLSVAMLSTHDTTNWPAWWENEAGTVDEGLFIRKCHERGLEALRLINELFDPRFSRYGRLRWKNSIDSVDKLVSLLGKPRQELPDFVEMYQNTFREKEKLWKLLALSGPMQEKSSPRLIHAVIKECLDSRAIFFINPLLDFLFLHEILKDDPYRYRINFPGTISEKNWSLVMPLSLEKLFQSGIDQEIHKMLSGSGRIHR
ncbi:MAG: 4-alpha-glucanotransferase [Candidatus Omnitrophica bacterium]|nr:4-alpha-glucanotransferase [Candidatus Omnitrophota bacterium]MDD5513563.1 4-alpha-glucanotransferase [Candidatus Omnitrophota bacterium]